MEIAFYKVDNPLGFDRHTFDYKDSEEIKSHLQQLKDAGGEVEIFNLEDILSIYSFVEGYNDEIFDGGWWCVLIK